MKITIIGLSITSAWGNGHAITYRNLLKALNKRGHEILFLERYLPGNSHPKDLPNPDFCQVVQYHSSQELKEKHTEEIKYADMVIVGSSLYEGLQIGKWVCMTAQGIKAFYDLDSSTTLIGLEKGNSLYISAELVPEFDLFLSLTGGHALDYLEKKFCSPMARSLYCCFDPELFFPEPELIQWDLGYLSNYSRDKQISLKELLLDVTNIFIEKKFVVAGFKYPENIVWPANVERKDHIAPDNRRKFYNSQRFTLNITSNYMVKMGYSPGIRLFEAAACGIPIISDYWEGMESFFEPGIDILIAESKQDSIYYLQYMSEEERRRVGKNGRRKVLRAHTSAHRALELESYVLELINADPVKQNLLSKQL